MLNQKLFQISFKFVVKWRVKRVFKTSFGPFACFLICIRRTVNCVDKKTHLKSRKTIKFIEIFISGKICSSNLMFNKLRQYLSFNAMPRGLRATQIIRDTLRGWVGMR